MNTMTNLLCKKPFFFLILSAVVLAVYIQAIDAPFVLDDPRVIERNLKIRDISNFLQLKEAFSARPLVNFSFAINYWIDGLDVRIYHVTNLLFHIANTILVFFLTSQIFSLSRKTETTERELLSAMGTAPFFAAALFALHPIQSQAVIYISQRAALMACFFYLLSVICYIRARWRYRETSKNIQSWLLFALCAMFAVMAFLSKKNVASLPLMILMVELMLFSNFKAGWGKKLAGLLGLMILITLSFAWFAGAFKGDLINFPHRLDHLTRETTDVSRWQYLITQFTVILLYMRLIAFPNGLNIDHGYPMKNEFFQGFTPYAFLILLSALILSLLYAKKHKILSFGTLWFLIALSMESSIFPIRDAMFEQRVYLAFPGVCMIFSWLLIRVAPEKTTAKIWIIGAVSLACTIGVCNRAQTWENELLLWQDAVKKAPRNARAWDYYGNALLVNGNRQAAFSAYRHAIEVTPSYSTPYCNLGKLYAEKGNLQKAEVLFLQSIERNPRFAEAHNNLAINYMLQNETQKGIKHFEKAIQFDSERPMVHYNLGKAYLDSHQPDKAMEQLMLAISMKPNIQPTADYLVGTIWALKGESENAARWVHRARQKGLDKALEFVKKDPRFDSCRTDVLAKLHEL